MLTLFENSCMNEIPAFAGVQFSGGRLNKKSGKFRQDCYRRVKKTGAI